MNRDLGTALQNVDRRIIYTVLFIVLAVPLLKPIGLPISITNETRVAYDTIDAIPSGKAVLFSSTIGPSNAAEIHPQGIAVMKHLISKKVKVVFAPTGAEALQYQLQYAQMCKDAGYVEGQDYILLPFMAGEETVYAAIGKDIKSLYTSQPKSPLWDSIKDVTDFALIVDSSGGPSQRYALAHIGGPRKVKIVPLVVGVILTTILPYFSAGQLSGIVAALSGAAEYETLVKAPGKGLSGMDAQSLGHLWVILLVVVGNIAYYLSKKDEPQKGGASR
jgi:hypothetical protein